MAKREIVIDDASASIYMPGVVISVNLTAKENEDTLVTVNRDVGGPTERILRGVVR